MSQGKSASLRTARLCLLSCGFFWAIDTVCFKKVLETTPAATGLCLRDLLIGSFILLALIPNSNRRALVLTRSQRTAMMCATVSSGIIADLLFYWALEYAPIVNGLVLGHLQPFFVTLFAIFVSRADLLGVRQFLGGVLMFFAAVLVTSKEPSLLFNYELGSKYDLIMIVAAVFWATSTILYKRYMNDVSPTAFVFYRYMPAGFLLLPIMIFSTGFTWNVYLIPNGLALLFGMWLYFIGLKSLKAAEAAFLELFSVFFGAILGWFVLGETTSPQQIVGIAVLFLGVYLLCPSVEPEPPVL